MKYITKLKLAAIHQLCDAEDRSTEYMFQYMQDMCNVDHDTVLMYFTLSPKEKRKLFREVNDFVSMFAIMEGEEEIEEEIEEIEEPSFLTRIFSLGKN